MRHVQVKQLLYIVWLGGCGASTGLGTSNEAALPSTTSTDTGGITYGGAVAGVGGSATGALGGTFDVPGPTGGRPNGTGGWSYPSRALGGHVATGGVGVRATGGTRSATGGVYVGTGGKVMPTGGTTYLATGGAKAATGGTSYTGGASAWDMATGGTSYTGGARSVGGFGTGGSLPMGSMKISTDGYAAIPAGLYTLHGYIYSFAGGSLSYIKLDYGSLASGSNRSFCGSGVVAANPTYVSYAGAGVNVNQATASSGSTVDSLTIDAKYITVSFTNQGGSQLRVQLNDATNNNWCHDISGATSPVTIPLTAFNTHCWDNSGVPFAPGTAITTIQLLVPGDAVVDRPFNFCLLGVTFA